MKVALITEEQIKTLEDYIRGSYDPLIKNICNEALAIVKSLKVMDHDVDVLAADARESARCLDDEAVDRFSAAMKAKLASSRAKGRDGWNDPERCTVTYLSVLLHNHVAKGDPVDVANFCMMLNERGSGIKPAQPSPKQQEKSE